MSKWLHKRYERFIVKRKYTRVVGVSEHTFRSLLASGVSPSRAVVILNGQDYGSYQNAKPQPPEQFKCCYFGRLGPSKGVDLLLAGWKLFSGSHPAARLVLIVPTRPEKAFRRLRDIVTNLHISGSIELKHGLSDTDLRQTILQSSCVIIPSLSEGFCFAAVEACALGVPVISSQRGALPEVVSGKVMPIAALSDVGISAALERAVQGQWETISVKVFELDRMLEAYSALYARVILQLLLGIVHDGLLLFANHITFRATLPQGIDSCYGVCHDLLRLGKLRRC
jgi:glycosyltransferase involved in cell wall biosynthesis